MVAAEGWKRVRKTRSIRSAFILEIGCVVE